VYEAIAQAAAAIHSADALLITAGAGMGVDSGLPDFRGTEGFWNAYPPYRHLGLSLAQLANPMWFERDPQLAWGFYGHRLNLYRATMPHAGFSILQKWTARLPGGARIFTSNVDGQFQKAGFAEDHIAECHGSIHHLQCTRGCRGIWSSDGVNVEVDARDFRARGDLPTCPECRALARPNILMFGDDAWLSDRSQTQEEKLDAWLRAQSDKRLVIIECGAGTAIPTVRRFSDYQARGASTTLVRINMRESEVPSGVGIQSGALEALTAIDASLGAG